MQQRQQQQQQPLPAWNAARYPQHTQNKLQLTPAHAAAAHTHRSARSRSPRGTLNSRPDSSGGKNDSSSRDVIPTSNPNEQLAQFELPNGDFDWEEDARRARLHGGSSAGKSGEQKSSSSAASSSSSSASAAAAAAIAAEKKRREELAKLLGSRHPDDIEAEQAALAAAGLATDGSSSEWGIRTDSGPQSQPQQANSSGAGAGNNSNSSSSSAGATSPRVRYKPPTEEELKEKLKEQGLKTSDKKPALVKRLTNALQGNTSSASAASSSSSNPSGNTAPAVQAAAAIRTTLAVRSRR